MLMMVSRCAESGMQRTEAPAPVRRATPPTEEERVAALKIRQNALKGNGESSPYSLRCNGGTDGGTFFFEASTSEALLAPPSPSPARPPPPLPYPL